MSTDTENRIYEPDLTWSDDAGNGPKSGRFDDVYFSPKDGLAETDYVFLKGIGAPDIWAETEQFTIGELGFGSGLNFLKSWLDWRTSSPAGARLNYVAIEGYPMAADDMARALQSFPELAELSAALIGNFPVLHPGFHQVSLDGGRVTLTLLFGPAQVMAARLIGRVDAWYLDGFAPSRNPDMWTPEVLGHVARTSRPGTRLATFTAAGQVRRDLQELGFYMEKAPGYDGKRECLRGEFKGKQIKSGLAPWYELLAPISQTARIAIIGGGVAGAALANALRRSNADVCLYERHPEPAGEASGNPAGLLQPRPADPRTPFARFQTDAYLHALQTYGEISEDIWKGPQGIVTLARDDAFLERYTNWIQDNAFPSTHARVLRAGEMAEATGVDLPGSGVLFPQAGTIDPAEVCRALLGDTACRFNAEIAELRQDDGNWQLLSGDGHVIGEADAVILANGVDVTRLTPNCTLALHGKRGQITSVAATDKSKRLKVGLSYGGYATPAVDGAHVLGATYQICPNWQDQSWRDLSGDDDAENLALPGQRSDALANLFGDVVIGGRASLRTTTADHLPVIGPLFDDVAFEETYGDLRHGRPIHRYPPASELNGPKGLYVCTAFGSRGFAIATLAAEILVAQMFGLPIPAEKQVIEAIHPARFLARDLKRR